MAFDRETIASAFVATGGAWLLGSAAFRRRSGRWNAAQVRGMTYAGVGFLLSAASARWLQHLGNRGIAVSLVGTMLAMRGMYTLLRERAVVSAASKSVDLASPPSTLAQPSSTTAATASDTSAQPPAPTAGPRPQVPE